MSQVTFDAFALPARIGISTDAPPAEQAVMAAPDLAPLGYDERGVRVRYVDARPEWIDSVADALIEGGAALSARPAADIAEVLGRVGKRFLDSADPLRAKALRLLPPTSGLSDEMSAAVLDGMAADWTEERLMGLLRAELGTEAVLDGFVRSAMAVGPTLAVQIVAGSVPGVGVSALLRSLLLKGPTLLKPGRGDVVLPVLFARALREADPALASALAVVYWPGGERDLEDAALTRADVVTAYGSDETVADLRARTPITVRFVAYHHRVSVGIVGRDASTEDRLEATVAEVAEAVALFDNNGCVSPQVIFVEEGVAGAADVARASSFATALSEQLRTLESRLPSGELDTAAGSALHQFRGTAELLATTGEVELIHGGEAPWTVILELDPSLAGSCSGRLVRVRSVADVREVPALLAPLARHLQTVGVVGLGARLVDTALMLGKMGASRVVPFRSVAFPPPWWHHDGRGPLRDLLRWVDLEEE